MSVSHCMRLFGYFDCISSAVCVNMREESLPSCFKLQHRVLQLVYMLDFGQESKLWLEMVTDTFNRVVDLLDDIPDLQDDIRLAVMNVKIEVLSIYCFKIYLYNHILLCFNAVPSIFWWRPKLDFKNRSEIDYAKVIVEIIYSIIVKPSGMVTFTPHQSRVSDLAGFS